VFAFANLDKSLRWDATYYKLLELDRHVSEFVPSSVSVLPMSETAVFWKPPKASAADEQDAALEDGDEDSDVHNSDDSVADSSEPDEGIAEAARMRFAN
jgi:hypothetical protein